ncbi:MAG TPA: family 1 encapsulin nanocompartment shell protein [Gammaproteobacteria bacterium]
MDHLHRELAPIDGAAWEEIDREAQRTLHRTLAGRQLVDFSGPHGWSYSCVGSGRTTPLPEPLPGTRAAARQARALIELTVPFRMARAELDAIARGAQDADLTPVTHAARTAALAEDRVIFGGFGAGGIRGIGEAGAGQALTLTDDYEKYPKVVASALTWLRHHGIDGPYAVALGPRCYQGLTETVNRGGYPVINLVRQQLDGRIVWAPAVDGAVVLSTRGGDFELVVGQDFSIGYASHDAGHVELYVQETITFAVYTPEAAVPLVYETAEKR